MKSRPTAWVAEYSTALRPLGRAQAAFRSACLAGDTTGMAAADQLLAAATDARRWLARNPCPVPAGHRHVEAGVRCLQLTARLATALTSTSDDQDAAVAAIADAWGDAERHFRAFAAVLRKAKLAGPNFAVTGA